MNGTMSDTDKALGKLANAANARTSRLHAEICGGADKAKAIQHAAVANARLAEVRNVNDEPAFADVVPYWAERAPATDTVPTRTVAQPVVRAASEPAFAEPSAPTFDPAKYREQLGKEGK